MTPDEFRAWRRRHGLTQVGAGVRLGKGRRTIQGYEQEETPIPESVARHCRDIDALEGLVAAAGFEPAASRV